MSDKSQPSPTSISVIFNAENCLKISESGYLKACGNDMQKVADTIVSFGVSRWSALSEHSIKKGRGPIIPGERKSRGGTPGPRKPKEAGAIVTRNGVEATIAKLTKEKIGNDKKVDKQMTMAEKIESDLSELHKPASGHADPKESASGGRATVSSKGKEGANGHVVHDKPSKEWLRQQAAEAKAGAAKGKDAAKTPKAGTANGSDAKTKATSAPTTPKPSKAAAKAPQEWVITYNPRRQTCCVPQGDAKTEADAREYAVREFKVDPKKILHIAGGPLCLDLECWLGTDDEGVKRA